MDRTEALAILDLPHSAGETEIARQSDLRRTELEKRVANAPTFPLKAKYRSELARLESAMEVLQTAEPSHDMGELPVMQKVEEDSDMGFGESLNRQQVGTAAVPPPLGSTRKPPQRPEAPPSPDTSRRLPPQRSNGSSTPERRPPPIPPAAPSFRSPARAAHPVDEEDEPSYETHPKPPRPPRPAWVLWTVLGVCVLLLAGSGYAGWRFWYLPKIERENLATAVRLLNSIGSQAANIPDTVPKVRTLACVAAALGNAGEGAAADNLLSQGRATLESMTAELSRSQLECDLLAAQAAKGDAQGALSVLASKQAAREKLPKPALLGPAKSTTMAKPAANIPRVPLWEDMARRGIAIAQARQGKWQEAQGTINGIWDDLCACEALMATVDAMVKAGEGTQTITLMQTLEERSKKITDAKDKAVMLCTVAERIYRMSAKADLKSRLVRDAVGAASSGAGSGPVTASMVLGQARVLRTLWRTKDKAAFEKRIVEVTGSIGNLNGKLGINNQRPDFAARAEAYAAVAIAWNESGNEENAANAITAAISAAEQAKLPVEDATASANGLSLDLHKQGALGAVAKALAEMRQFDQAEQILGRLTDPGELAEAGEAIAYWLGWEGEIERGESIASRLPDGEARCRGVVALQYGVRHADLDRWW